MISYGLLEILQQRADQLSFHVVSEKAIRIEFMRFSNGQELGPIHFEGDVVITCLEGVFTFGEDEISVAPLTQVVIPEGERLRISCCSENGAVQIIWAPPFADWKRG